jgi:hypothetical protein
MYAYDLIFIESMFPLSPLSIFVRGGEILSEL